MGAEPVGRQRLPGRFFQFSLVFSELFRPKNTAMRFLAFFALLALNASAFGDFFNQFFHEQDEDGSGHQDGPPVRQPPSAPGKHHLIICLIYNN